MSHLFFLFSFRNPQSFRALSSHHRSHDLTHTDQFIIRTSSKHILHHVAPAAVAVVVVVVSGTRCCCCSRIKIHVRADCGNGLDHDQRVAALARNAAFQYALFAQKQSRQRQSVDVSPHAIAVVAARGGASANAILSTRVDRHCVQREFSTDCSDCVVGATNGATLAGQCNQ
jgi:hypothetical protein